MSDTWRAVIVDGSMAALFAAIALRARGFDVAIYERANSALANRGAGIASHRGLYDALGSAGVELRDEMGAASLGCSMLDRHGREIYRHDMAHMYDFVSEQLLFDGVALLGDAEFTARPHVGMGMSKAAADVSTFAAALARAEPARASGEWERERIRYGAAIVQWGRDLGRYLGPPAKAAAPRAIPDHYSCREILHSAAATTDTRAHLNL